MIEMLSHISSDVYKPDIFISEEAEAAATLPDSIC